MICIEERGLLEELEAERGDSTVLHRGRAIV
jgi:hypothetical protein